MKKLVIKDEDTETLEVSLDELVKFEDFVNIMVSGRGEVVLTPSNAISKRAICLGWGYQWDLVKHKGNTYLIARRKEGE